MPEDSANPVTASTDSSVEQSGSHENTGDNAEYSASETLENVRDDSKMLDALDELPENKRRASIILVVIAGLAVFSIIILIMMPPLGWSPQKGVKSDYAPVAAIQNVSSEGSGDWELAYKSVESEIVYDAEIEQRTYYADNGVSRFSLKTGVSISRPARRSYEDEIAIKLQDVDVHIFDNDVEVNLASAGELLEGIYMFSRLEAHEGMYSIVPDANINPQVARMLFAVSDAVRQIWAPLPSEKLGYGSKWNIADNADEKSGLRRVADAELKSCSEDGCSINSVIRLEKTGLNDGDILIGSGGAGILIKDGVVLEAVSHFERNRNVWENAAEKQETKIKFVLK